MELIEIYTGLSLLGQGLWLLAKVTPTQADDKLFGKVQRALSPANDLIKKLLVKN